MKHFERKECSFMSVCNKRNCYTSKMSGSNLDERERIRSKTDKEKHHSNRKSPQGQREHSRDTNEESHLKATTKRTQWDEMWEADKVRSTRALRGEGKTKPKGCHMSLQHTNCFELKTDKKQNLSLSVYKQEKSFLWERYQEAPGGREYFITEDEKSTPWLSLRKQNLLKQPLSSASFSHVVPSHYFTIYFL